MAWKKGNTSPFKGRKHSEKSLQKMRDCKKGKNHPMWGKKLPPEMIMKLREMNLAEKNPSYGTKHTQEHKNKIGISTKIALSNPEIKEKMKLKSLEHAKDENIRLKWVKAKLGDKNSNWRGGLSYEPYSKDFSREFKRLIKLRDNNCLVCDSDIKLCVHHIDYNKLNSVKENCVTLCEKCHVHTNFNREQWTEFFHSILINKYKYYYIVEEVEIKNKIK